MKVVEIGLIICSELKNLFWRKELTNSDLRDVINRIKKFKKYPLN